MPRLVIRPADDADWSSIATLLQHCSLPLDGAREHLRAYLVAVVDGAIVGTAGLKVYGDAALLRSVAVAPAWRGLGIGRVLVEAATADARRRHVKTLHLLTTTAADSFSKVGFSNETPADVASSVKASAEFQGTCLCGVHVPRTRGVERGTEQH